MTLKLGMKYTIFDMEKKVKKHLIYCAYYNCIHHKDGYCNNNLDIAIDKNGYCLFIRENQKKKR